MRLSVVEKKYSLLLAIFSTFPSVFCTSHVKADKSISFANLEVDRPKIRVLQFRLKSSKSHQGLIASPDTSCSSGRRALKPWNNGADAAAGLSLKTRNCDPLIDLSEEVSLLKPLGQDGGEQREWIVPPNVTQLSLQCQSKGGPVEWDYQGKGIFPDIEVRSKRAVGDFWSPTTYTHYSRLTFNKVDDQLTGTFICRNVAKPSVSNSFYLFVPREKLPIYPPKQTIHVHAGPYDHLLTIPCRAEDKRTTIYLYKRLQDGSLRSLDSDLEPSLTFDPYLGFELSSSEENYGHYVCKVDKKKVEETSRRRGRRADASSSPGFLAFPTSEEFEGMFVSPDDWYNSNTYESKLPIPIPVGSKQQRVEPKRGEIRTQPAALSKRISLPQGQGPIVLGPNSRPQFPFRVRRKPMRSRYPPRPPRPPPRPYFQFLKGGEPSLRKPSTSEGASGTHPHTEFKEKQNDQADSSSIEEINSSSNATRVPHQHKKPPRKGLNPAVLSPNLLPQTMTIVNSMGCVLKKVMLGPEASCNGSFFEHTQPKSRTPEQKITSWNSEDQDTILEIVVHPPLANAFYPPEPNLFTTVPFFLKWQTRSTDFANWAQINTTLRHSKYKLHKAGHLADDGIHSMEVFNLAVGEGGNISVPYVDPSTNQILVHTWSFLIINSTADRLKGLEHKLEGSKHQFTCRSSTTSKPKITLSRLTEDGCRLKDEDKDKKKRRLNKNKTGVVEEDCGPGCSSIRTDVEYGIVTCVGDGVDETLRHPSDLPYCTGRPYYVERGMTKNLTLHDSKTQLLVPCAINNPNADVYLLHKSSNGTKFADVTDYATYDLKSGFTLNVENVDKPLGTLLCTSTSDPEDLTDVVTFNIQQAANYLFNPPYSKVHGSPPFRFVWESIEELEVDNKSLGNFYSGVFAKPDGNRPFVGTFEISSLPKGQEGVVNIVKASTKEIVHTWHYAYQGKYGLWVDRKLNVFKCKSTSGNRPALTAVECANPNECRLKKRFVTKDTPGEDSVKCGSGCTELKIWKNRPNGFVKCKEDEAYGGMEDSLNYFLSPNSSILTEINDLHAIKTVEIYTSEIRRIKVGEWMTATCRANRHFYSSGFQWAVESKDGSKRFLDQGKQRESDSYFNEITSEVKVQINDKEMKALWCYVPSINSNEWGSSSQLIYT